MPSFQDSIFIFFLALIFLGPKKLPVLARELGKWMAEFRRASNEFKMQMEDELRASEQAERDKKTEALAAENPSAAELPAPAEPEPAADPTPTVEQPSRALTNDEHFNSLTDEYREPVNDPLLEANQSQQPIATSGDLSILPPDTGLPATYGEHPPVEATDPSPAFETSNTTSGLTADGTRRPDPAPSEAAHG